MFYAVAALDFLQKIDDKLKGYLSLILAVLAILFLILLIFFAIASKIKSKRIRSLKKKIAELKAEAEVMKSREKNEEIFSPQIGEKAVFGSESSSAAQAETANDSVRAAQPATQKDEEIEVTDDESITDNGVMRSASDESVKYIVKYDRMKDSWVIKKAGSERVIRRFKTKDEALSEARAMCKRSNATLVVHKKDGKFQKQ